MDILRRYIPDLSEKSGIQSVSQFQQFQNNFAQSCIFLTELPESEDKLSLTESRSSPHPMKTPILTALLLIANISAAPAISASSIPQFTQANRINQQSQYRDSIASDDRLKQAEIYYNRGNQKYHAGNKRGAILEFDRAISIYPRIAEAYNNRGAIKFELGDLQGAMADCNKATSINPSFAGAYLNRGLIQSKLGNYRAATLNYNKAISLDNNLAEAYYNRGFIKSKSGDRQDAISDYSQAISIAPNHSKAYYNRGIERAKLGNRQGAMSDFDRAIENDPNYASAYQNRGVLKSMLGDNQAAIGDLSRAAKLFRQQGKTQEYQRVLALLKEIDG
jgi:tetratricopeptide (TPR) repeat protein